jgi:hypothetical protein
MEAIKALMEFSGEIGKDAMLAFQAAIIAMVGSMVDIAGGFDEDGLAAATAFAAAAGTVGGGIKNALEGIKLLMEYSGGLATSAIDTFVADMKLVVEKLEEAAAGFSEDGLTAAAAFAEAAGAVGGGIDDAISGLKLLMEYSGGLAVSTVDTFVADMKLVVEKLEEAAADFSADGLAAAVSFATSAGSIGGGISDAVEGFAAISQYSSIAKATIDDFLADMQYVVTQIVAASGAFSDEGLAKAQQYADTAKDIGDFLKAGYEGLVGDQGIYGYLGVGHEVIDLFLADMQYVVSKVVAAADLFTTAGLQRATALSNAMKAVGSALESGVGGLIKPQGKEGVTIASYAGVAHDVFDLFIADMVYVVGIVEQAAMEFTEKGITQAEKFAAAGERIFKAIKEGIASVIAMQGTGDASGLGVAMIFITQSVIDAVTAIADQFNILKTAAWEFGRDWVLMLINGINSRLSDLEELMEYIRGLFPSSPAKYGAWRDMPDGRSVGEAFATGLAGGVDRGQYAVADALNGLRRSFDGGINGQRGGFGGSGLVVNQVFNIGHGDPSTVRDAARLGVIEATRMLGVA